MPEKNVRDEGGETAGGETTVKEKICPECEGKMVPRTSRFGPFWGCSNYPKCKHLEKK